MSVANLCLYFIILVKDDLFSIKYKNNIMDPPSNMQIKGRKKDSIEQFISSPQLFLENSLSQLRYMILIEGLSTPPGYDLCPYRCYVWSILCRVPTFSTDMYGEIMDDTVDNLSPELYQKIKMIRSGH